MRKDVDPKRLAYVGHSYHATVGGFLSGCDHRFKAFVLMAGGLSDEVDEKSKEFQQFRQSVGPEKFDAFQAKYSWLDAGKFTPHAAPVTVFLQYATQEDFPHARARARVCRDCQRTEAVQTLRRTACAQRRSPPRPHRVPCRAAQPKAGSVAGSDRRDSQSSSTAQPGHE
jgi:hypothetical protein